MRDKLEENKDTIRKLEDENLEAKFQLTAAKEKIAYQMKKIKDLKETVQKYYKKLQRHQDISESIECMDSPHFDPNRKKIARELMVDTSVNYGGGNKTLLKDLELESPKTAGFKRRNSSPDESSVIKVLPFTRTENGTHRITPERKAESAAIKS